MNEAYSIDLKALREWQQQGNRSVTIELGRADDPSHVSIWVYDYDLMIGQYVRSIDEINLLEKAQIEAFERVNRIQTILDQQHKITQ